MGLLWRGVPNRLLRRRLGVSPVVVQFLAAACAADGLPCSIWAVAHQHPFQTGVGCAAAFFYGSFA